MHPARPPHEADVPPDPNSDPARQPVRSPELLARIDDVADRVRQRYRRKLRALVEDEVLARAPAVTRHDPVLMARYLRRVHIESDEELRALATADEEMFSAAESLTLGWKGMPWTEFAVLVGDLSPDEAELKSANVRATWWRKRLNRRRKLAAGPMPTDPPPTSTTDTE